MEENLLMQPGDLENYIRQSVKDAISELENGKTITHEDKLFTINQVSKKLGKSFRTVKKWVNSGILQTTKSGLISEAALTEYLNG